MANVYTIEQRKSILQSQIVKYVKKGFRVTSQTDTTAQLIKPKQFSFFWFLVNLFLIIGWVFYLAWYLAKKDETIFLEVNENGRVIVRK